MIPILLRIEGAAAFIAALSVYWYAEFSWFLFAFVFLAPDLFMLGYLKNERLGALTYNLGHTYTSPFVLFAVSGLAGWRAGFAIAIVWVAHIAMDRMLGFGLKHPSGFKDTHLGRLGR